MLTQDVTPSPEELVRVFFESVEPSTKEYAVLPYIRGLTEPLKRLLKHYDIKVISIINCADCSWKYIGETGRSLETRKKEHIRNVKKCKVGSNIDKHAWDNDHAIDFSNSKVIDRANSPHRGTLKS